ncbi:MAG: hypothetical protein FRX49_03321 [Trebouxia sp. A1-2]|nr:MAG: hypothetical protein FRX49_03321 [Trebouxia sp. A1-2]
MTFLAVWLMSMKPPQPGVRGLILTACIKTVMNIPMTLHNGMISDATALLRCQAVAACQKTQMSTYSKGQIPCINFLGNDHLEQFWGQASPAKGGSAD